MHPNGRGELGSECHQDPSEPRVGRQSNVATRGNQRTAATTVMHSGKQIPGLSVSRKRCLRFASSSTQFPVARFGSFTVAIRSFATLSDGPVRVEQRQMADANVKEDNDAGAGVEQTPAARDEEALGQDPESDEDVNVDPEELKEALSRPPPVNSDYLPLPWKGRLGYVRLLHLFIFRSSESFRSDDIRPV